MHTFVILMFSRLLFFSFLMIRLPPRSTRTDTLFPYTTLFRSRVSAAISVLLPTAKPMRHPAMLYVLDMDVNSTATSFAPGTCRMEGDRKSTRLNSSH